MVEGDGTGPRACSMVEGNYLRLKGNGIRMVSCNIVKKLVAVISWSSVEVRGYYTAKGGGLKNESF